MTELKNKVAIITGGGGGIGSAVAQTLAANGMKIALLGGNNLEKLSATADAVRKYSDCLVIPGDLTDMEFLSGAVSQAAEYFGKIDTLINNAGVAQNTPFEAVSVAEFDRIMAINTKVPYFLTQFTLPFLRKSDAAAVINIASVVAHAGYPQQSVYTASKHALLGMTKSIANELHKENIRVHAISPGGVYTDMVKISRPDLSPDGMIMPEDIAEIVLFFLARRTNAVIDEICVHRLGKEPFQI
ncbi:MAG: SDR family oxidoreductase [Lentisphaerae bacterium]|nr:SDR family oxidoreductase [Lentisphaerota bacterium]